MTHKAIFEDDNLSLIKSLWSEMGHRLTEQNLILDISDEQRFEIKISFGKPFLTTFELQRINTEASFICKQKDFHIDSIYFLKMKKIHLRSGSPSDIQKIVC